MNMVGYLPPKYCRLPAMHIFLPVAIETLGPLRPSAYDYIDEIGQWTSYLKHQWR